MIPDIGHTWTNRENADMQLHLGIQHHLVLELTPETLDLAQPLTLAQAQVASMWNNLRTLKRNKWRSQAAAAPSLQPDENEQLMLILVQVLRGFQTGLGSTYRSHYGTYDPTTHR